MNQSPNFERIPDSIDFPMMETQILTLWRKLDAFRTCLKQSEDRPKYSFYDGPPFATGLPHYGHILAGTVKDIITRHAHQQGYHVERRFGWDCHGLPIEYEVDKSLEITDRTRIETLGIDYYNSTCRKIVMKHAEVWETVMERIGRWVDFENDYKTMYPWYMESIWWVFKQLYAKGMVYKGVKVMPFSTVCHTPLSNFESGQNYKSTIDPAIVVSFPIVNDEASLIAWTTTPWTLPSNLALCVNPQMEYARIRVGDALYIGMKERLNDIFKEYETIDVFLGSQLEGLRYEPLFKYFEGSSAFRVVCDGYVSCETGTGIVHQAPYFGEDDYRVCLAAGVIHKDQEPVCPVDENGKFTSQVVDFQGVYVKQADSLIISKIKSMGRLVQQGQVKHSYPFCWRSDTPLIYKAVSSWFVRVESVCERLVRNTGLSYWVPEFVRDRRFVNWLKDARDWSISRNRYWGTPIPIWSSEDGKEVVCIGSIEELQKLTGQEITDLHREYIDHILIPSKTPGNPPLKRIPEVFDCWFESGAMPYAQKHYPFENQKNFEEYFPADFIAEGIDQTRGWFYTLLVLSTALFDQPPFKNVIATGLVLASDGQKMSKRKKNYPDPIEMVRKYGADALRLYLINSPVVRAENLKFKEDGIRDVVKQVFLPWFNAFRFLIQNIDVFNQKSKGEKENSVEREYFGSSQHEIGGQKNHNTTNQKNMNQPELQELTKFFRYDPKHILSTTNLMDIWILSSIESLLKFVLDEMKEYHLYSVVPKLTRFIEDLTNWYVRMNRKRLKGENGPEETVLALNVLFYVILLLVKIMAPFTPFTTEYMYQHLKNKMNDPENTSTRPELNHNLCPPGLDNLNHQPNSSGDYDLSSSTSTGYDSIHYLLLPSPKSNFFNKSIERSVGRMQKVIDLGRTLRDKNVIPLKYPLPEMIIIHHDPEYIHDLICLTSYILSELNIKKISTTTDKHQYGISLKAEPDHKTLGARLKHNFKPIINKIKTLTSTEIEEIVSKGWGLVSNERVELGDIRVMYTIKDGLEGYKCESDNDLIILVDTKMDESMQEEGVAREVINRVQKLRKKANLVPTDQVKVYYEADENLEGVADRWGALIEGGLKTRFLRKKHYEMERVIIEEEQQLKSGWVRLMIVSDVEKDEEDEYSVVNVCLEGVKGRYDRGSSDFGCIIIDAGREYGYGELVEDVRGLFNIYGVVLRIVCDEVVVDERFNIKNVFGNDLHVYSGVYEEDTEDTEDK